MDYEKYQRVKQEILTKPKEKQGIGTLSEKTIHAILKKYYAYSPEETEVSLAGKIVDIFTGSEIIEIQTRAFERMRGKLSILLDLYRVTIVYPVPRYKYIVWMEEDTGQVSTPRKSPKKGSVYDIFPELYKIKAFLLSDRLHFKIVLMDMEEYRLLNGWSRDKKKGSVRFDRIPLDYVEEVEVTCKEDYMMFVPYNLEDEFTVVEFAKAAKIPRKLAGQVVPILLHVGIVRRIGKRGRSYVYSTCN
ncbi:MAG: hypothetical protein R3Y67_03820 [Eubacteriales bacterium]